MKKIQLNIAVVLANILALFFTTTTNAETVIPSDYIIAGNIGDTWDYERSDSTLFTWTLSEINTGPNAELLERGNDDSGMVYDLAGNVLSIYEIDKNPLDPVLTIGEMELGHVVTYDDDPINPTMFLFWKIPSITVQAGTFNDVLAWVFLDGAFGSNQANTFLGLDPLINAAVTDINYFVQGIGEVAYLGIDAATGIEDGFYELVHTTFTDSDSDNDGLPDTYEDLYIFLNLLDDTDAALDQDSDGLSNLEEYLAGTQPDNPDSDADGRIDGLDSDPLIPAPNLCSGDNVVLINDVYATGTIFDCRAQVSIQTDGTVTVESGAEALYMAPVLRLDTGFSVEAGGVFHAVGATTVAP